MTRPDPRTPLAMCPGPALVSRFAAQVERRPAHIAVRDDAGAWSYRALDTWSNRVAHWLVRRGATGGVVAIHGPRSVALVGALLGVLKAGATFVVLDAAYPPHWHASCLEVVSPRALVAIGAVTLPDGRGPPLGATTSIPVLALRKVGLPVGALDDLPNTQLPVSAMPGRYVLFTSGTTGVPRAVAATDCALGHFLDWYCERFELGETERFGMLAGPSHDPALRDIFAPLSLGATLCIPDAATLAEPRRLVMWLAAQRVTTVHIGPALGRMLSGVASAPLVPELRHVFFHGDTVTTGDVAALSRWAPNAACVALYGATETPQAMAYCPAIGLADGTDAIPIGSAIDGVQLLVLDRAMQLVDIADVGEIYVRTPYLSDGYLGGAELTRERFVINPFTGEPGDRLYRTGDLGAYRPDGSVEFHGRADHQVKIAGMRVEPVQLERALLGYPGVRGARVLARPGRGGPRLSAYVAIPDPSGAGDAGALLRAFLAQRFPSKMVPSTMTVLAHLPLGPNGKVDDRALLSLGAEV